MTGDYIEEIRENYIGLFISRTGRIFTPVFNPKEFLERYMTTTGQEIFEIKPEMSASSYLYIDEKYMRYGTKCSTIMKPDRTETTGKYVHQMVVFSYGDCNGCKYNSQGFRSEIDHLDMDHENNCVDNLQLVSRGINLFRAYYKTKLKKRENDYNDCERRFKDYYNSLDEVDKEILKIEIELELKGQY